MRPSTHEDHRSVSPERAVFLALDDHFERVTDLAAASLQGALGLTHPPRELGTYEASLLKKHRARLAESAEQVGNILAARSVEWEPFQLHQVYFAMLHSCGVVVEPLAELAEAAIEQTE